MPVSVQTNTSHISSSLIMRASARVRHERECLLRARQPRVERQRVRQRSVRRVVCSCDDDVSSGRSRGFLFYFFHVVDTLKYIAVGESHKYIAVESADESAESEPTTTTLCSSSFHPHSTLTESAESALLREPRIARGSLCSCRRVGKGESFLSRWADVLETKRVSDFRINEITIIIQTRGPDPHNSFRIKQTEDDRIRLESDCCQAPAKRHSAENHNALW